MNDFPFEESEIDDLLEQARSGSREAFNKLFARHTDSLKSFVRIRLDDRIRSRIDASDVVQDTHIEAYRRFNDYYDRRPMPFAIWLRKNAFERLKNVRRDHVEAQKRSVSREQRLPDRSSVLIAGNFPGPISTPSEHFSSQEYQERVTTAVAKLNEQDRDLLLMRVVEARPYQEIAHLLDIGVATARKRYARILLKLQKILASSTSGSGE